MEVTVATLDFETSAIIRDEIAYLENEVSGKGKKAKKKII